MNEGNLRRWLDGELGEEDARAFLTGLSAAERREAEALAALGRAAARLPPARASEDLAGRAMARVRTRPAPRRSRWAWLRAPALSPLAALGAAALVGVGAFGLARWAAGPGDRGAPPAAYAVVRLAYRAPLAREVSVAGDFNGWSVDRARMRRGEGGVWTIELPLAPHRRYEYMLVVDGRWVTDPGAAATADDGYGGTNGVIAL